MPEFNDDGLWPPGDCELTFDQLWESPLVRASDDSPGWDVGWRLHLVNQLEVLTRQLWQVGITEVFADRSFAEDKGHPNDIDGYFVCSLEMLASGDLQRELNLLDPYKIWTWDPASRRPYAGYPKMQLPMWHRYRVELYPHISGMSSGIRDQHGNELEFPAAFRLSRRNDRPRGIIKLRQEGLT